MFDDIFSAIENENIIRKATTNQQRRSWKWFEYWYMYLCYCAVNSDKSRSSTFCYRMRLGQWRASDSSNSVTLSSRTDSKGTEWVFLNFSARSRLQSSRISGSSYWCCSYCPDWLQTLFLLILWITKFLSFLSEDSIIKCVSCIAVSFEVSSLLKPTIRSPSFTIPLNMEVGLIAWIIGGPESGESTTIPI